VQARAERRIRVAVIGALAGSVLASLAALLLPLFAALEPAYEVPVRLFALVLGGSVAIVAVLFGSSGEPPSARLGMRVGTLLGTSGVIVGGLGSLAALAFGPALGLPLQRATAAALGAGAMGLSIAVGVVAGVAAQFGGDQSAQPSSGVRLRLLIGGATGSITLATWALATAYLLGHFAAIGRQTAGEEARDLVVLADMLSPAELEQRAESLVPDGGFLARLDTRSRVLPGVSVGVTRDVEVLINEGPPLTCRAAGNSEAMPCATRMLGDSRRVVAAISPLPIPMSTLAWFLVTGIAAALTAFFTGSLLSRGPGDDLERVASVLDGLGLAGQGGLDRIIPAVSLDEVGDLSVALAHLRVRMRPNLAEHDEALQRANAADLERDHFLTLVSEELRAPLDRILDDSRQLLEGQEPLSVTQREDIRLIVGSSTHLTELIEEVLDLSAIATGQINLRLAEVDLASLANDVGHAQRPLLAGRQVALQMQVPEAGVRILADERRLRQVLTNLVSNAVKFTQAGSITIEVKSEPGGCVLRVRDTGPGIPAEQLPKLFSEFVQLGNLRQRARGTGLGLAICKRLIEAHGGTITAESVVGQGSTFIVTLPTAGTAAKA
jgi:signal transduction histidine kinase